MKTLKNVHRKNCKLKNPIQTTYKVICCQMDMMCLPRKTMQDWADAVATIRDVILKNGHFVTGNFNYQPETRRRDARMVKSFVRFTDHGLNFNIDGDDEKIHRYPVFASYGMQKGIFCEHKNNSKFTRPPVCGLFPESNLYFGNFSEPKMESKYVILMSFNMYLQRGADFNSNQNAKLTFRVIASYEVNL